MPVKKKFTFLSYFVYLFIHVCGEVKPVDESSEDKPICEYDGLNFDFSGVGLSKIPKHFLSSSLVNCLNLEDNKIWDIQDGAFDELPNLYYLNLACNWLPYDNFKFNFSTIKILVLDDSFILTSKNNFEIIHTSKCPLCYGKEDFHGAGGLQVNISSGLPNLEKLYLRNNRLKSLSLGKAAPKLTHLYLDDNLNIDLSALFLNMPPTLTHLTLRRNSVLRFNHTLALSQLESLILDQNSIEILGSGGSCDQPVKLTGYRASRGMWGRSHYYSDDLLYIEPPRKMDLTGATKLKKLSLLKNNVKEITNGAFGDLHSLEYLDLSSNALNNIPNGTFTNLTNLNTLLLAANRLTSAPNVSGLVKLETLMLNDNKIESIGSTIFSNLPQLKILSLANNQITSIEPKSFYSLTSLSELYLSGNKLTILPGDWISPHSTLRRLHLDKNFFTDIESMALGNVSAIEYLHIAENPFEVLSLKSVKNLPEGTVINVKQKSQCIQQKYHFQDPAWD